MQLSQTTVDAIERAEAPPVMDLFQVKAPGKLSQYKGRPKATVDEAKLRELTLQLCPIERLAVLLDTSVNTLRRRYWHVICQNHETTKQRLLNCQLEAAYKGSIPMLIWLGKQVLGQSEKIEEKSIQTQFVINVSELPT